ncbi:hypothetical protein [Actinoplanes sp. NPDC051859]|uniref:hypothetical protein n=1 Tax=Actinoplanes sp. NPDC051859 TaxID=3363909 RepID=UPI00379E66E5
MLKSQRTIGADDPRISGARIFAEQLRHAITATSPDLPVDGLDRIPGSDATGTVTCYVDVRGDFVDLSIQSDWWYSVGPAGIASAVLDALAFAQEMSLIAMATLSHYGRTVKAREVDVSEFFPSQEEPVANLAAETAAASKKIDRAISIVDAADRIGRLRDNPQQRLITGPRGLFHITMTGFAVQRADVNEGALSASGADLLVEDARAALTQASREADPRYWLSRGVADL